jgi:OmcA/MtrC family decaheme c-type cytochrome
MCHNPNTTDAARRPAEFLPPQTVNFKNLIHSLHRGEDLENEFTIFGFGNTPNDFTEVRFPGLLQDCAICHVEGATDLPLPAEALSTLITNPSDGSIVREFLAERASCVSCHDGVLPNTHALLATDLNARIETCAVCHGPDSAFAVALVHRLSP